MDGGRALDPGTTIATHWRIERMLGEGGFGVTYEAEDQRSGHRVALKEYLPYGCGTRQPGSSQVQPASGRGGLIFAWGRERFMREAEMLSRLDHPSIVRVSDAFEANGTAYMALDYLRGGTLGAWLRNLGREPDQQELDGILKPLVEALSHVHSLFLLHRDIKPDNIMMTADGRPVLIDFGAAKAAIAGHTRSIGADEAVSTSLVVVSDGYSPPEQYAPQGNLQGPWTDIYALAATVYRAVTGVAPSAATARQVEESYRPLSTNAASDVGEGGQARPAWRTSFLAAIDQSLSLRREERPQSAAEFGRLLWLDETQAAGRRSQPRSGKPALIGVSKRDEAASRAASSSRVSRRGRDGGRAGPISWPGLAAAGAAVAILAGIAPSLGLNQALDRAHVAGLVQLSDGADLPLPHAAVTRLKDEVATAKTALRRTAFQFMRETPPNPRNNIWGWAIAQMIATAPPTEPSERVAYLDYMSSNLNTECGCFVVGNIRHAVTSAWALISYARLGQSPPAAALAGVLASQKGPGWWSAALDATDDDSNASLYVTALMTIALRAVADEPSLDQQRVAVVRQALQRASDWLLRQQPDAAGEWSDYPSNKRAQPSIVFGAMILAATDDGTRPERIAPIREALLRGYTTLPASHVYFPSDVLVTRANSGTHIDTYRHVPYPWVAYALASSYRERSLWERVRIARDLRDGLLVNLQSPAFRKQEWLLSEHIFVLEKVVDQLASKRAPAPRVVSR